MAPVLVAACLVALVVLVNALVVLLVAPDAVKNVLLNVQHLALAIVVLHALIPVQQIAQILVLALVPHLVYL